MKIVKYKIKFCLQCPFGQHRNWDIACTKIKVPCGQYKTKSYSLLLKNPFPEWCPLEDSDIESRKANKFKEMAI